MKKAILFITCLVLVYFGCLHSALFAVSKTPFAVTERLTPNDAVLLADPQHHILFAQNKDRPLIPASTLKLLTALAGFHILGPDYRFTTEFYIDAGANLKVKGYGDPLLISETLDEIARLLKPKLARFSELQLDDSYFNRPLLIPGVTASLNPYDAPNGALCANFNTVYFKSNPGGGYASAEPQTPLVPFALQMIEKSNLTHGRIIIPGEKHRHTLYAGHLLKYFLNRRGIKSDGPVRLGRVRPQTDRLLLQYRSPYPLTDVVARLLEYSNNFMANQILLAAGAKEAGAPGTLVKGVRSIQRYAAETLKIEGLHLEEGSGISRQNRIPAQGLFTVLQEFTPYYQLLRHEKGCYYKTGHLAGIRTRAGYMTGRKGGLYPFVIFLNGSPGSMQPVVRELEQFVRGL